MKKNLAFIALASFACMATPVPGIAGTVGGMVAGLGEYESVKLLNGGGDPITIGKNGAFSFPKNSIAGSTYAVSVQTHTPGIVCSVTHGHGTVGLSPVTDIGVLCTAGVETILHSFNGTDGTDPRAGLVMDSTGNLYGTTWGGRRASAGFGGGTVFKMSTTGETTVLHVFGEHGVSSPKAGLVIDRAGNLYGTTVWGGSKSGGTVFKISATGQETVLHSFGEDSLHNAQYPDAGLIMDGAGNLYGTTAGGGAYGYGTVFKISATGKKTVLHSFDPFPKEHHPYASLIMDSAGNLYGTTYDGGQYDGGTVYRISATGQETILHSFGTGTDGSGPVAALHRDGAGNLYGTTYQGGAKGGGTVFKISANVQETILHSFGTGTDGSGPVGGLIMDSAGNLYGTTYKGGANDDGTVFKISTAGNETVLHAFTAADGRSPKAGLVMDSAGNLYGTTYSGGPNGGGTVFKITAAGKETVLRAFHASDGCYPKVGLVMDSAGNLYGTTFYGGEREINAGGNGTVFEISATGKEVVLHSFGKEADRLGLEDWPRPVDGVYPDGALIRDGSGNLFGTTYSDGEGGDGTVFKISAAGKETVLYLFGGMDGAHPRGHLVMDANGNLYGTTSDGGEQNAGTVFRLYPSRKETVLHSFGDEVYKAISTGRSSVCDNSKACDGANPYGGLVIDNSGNLYGTTRYAGALGAGAVFKIN